MRLSLSTVSAVTVLCLSSVLVGSASGAESSQEAEQNLRKTQEAGSGEKKKPHVLMISVDDLNNWVGCKLRFCRYNCKNVCLCLCMGASTTLTMDGALPLQQYMCGRHVEAVCF